MKRILRWGSGFVVLFIGLGGLVVLPIAFDRNPAQTWASSFVQGTQGRVTLEMFRAIPKDIRRSVWQALTTEGRAALSRENFFYIRDNRPGLTAEQKAYLTEAAEAFTDDFLRGFEEANLVVFRWVEDGKKIAEVRYAMNHPLYASNLFLLKERELARRGKELFPGDALNPIDIEKDDEDGAGMSALAVPTAMKLAIYRQMVRHSLAVAGPEPCACNHQDGFECTLDHPDCGCSEIGRRCEISMTCFGPSPTGCSYGGINSCKRCVPHVLA